MNGLPISPSDFAGKGSRRRRESISSGRSLYEVALLVLLLLSVLTGIVLFGAVRPWSVSIVLLAVSLCATGYVLRPCFLPALRTLRAPPGLVALAVFFMYALVRVSSAPVRYEACLEVFKYGGFILAYAVWSGLGGRSGRWRWVFGILIFSVTLIGWYALIQHVHGTNRVLMLFRPVGYGMRASGTYICPNHFANLLGIVACISVGLLCMPEAGAVLRILSAYSLLLLVPVNVLTHSRSGWLGMIAGICCTLFLILWQRSRRGFWIALVVMPLLLTAAGGVLWAKSDAIRERITGMDMTSPDGSVQFRLNIWKETMTMISDAPWLGHGGGVFRWLHPLYKTTALNDMWAIYPHNEYLQAVSEYGAVGGVLLLWAGAAFVWGMLKTVFKATRPRDVVMASLALGALVTGLVHACFDFNYHVFANNMVLALVAGVVFSSLEKPENRAERVPAFRWSWIMYYSALLALAGMVLVQALRFGLSYGYTWAGQRASLLFREEEARADFQKALRWMPDYWVPLLQEAEGYSGRCLWERDAAEKKRLAEQAFALYDRVRVLNPLESEIQNGESRLYALLGDGEKALACLQEVLDEAPNEVFFLNRKGIQLRLMGRLEEAKACFERANQLNFNDISAMNLQLIQRSEAAAGRP